MKKERAYRLLIVLVLSVAVAVFAVRLYIMRDRGKTNNLPEAPDFTFTTIDGKNMRLSDFKGKVIIVDFFALWCDPCRIQLGVLKRVWPILKNHGVILLSIDIDPGEGLSDIKEHATSMRINWIIGSSPEAV